MNFPAESVSQKKFIKSKLEKKLALYRDEIDRTTANTENINEHFNWVRYEILRQTENEIEKLNQFCDELFEIIENYEKECIEKGKKMNYTFSNYYW
jgi:predicted nuclease with TOPRIM domain